MKYFFSICILLALFGCNKEATDAPHVPFVYTDSIQDLEGNYYHTVTIGSQVWMAENLRSTIFQNGDTIRFVPNLLTWVYDTVGQYCYYDTNLVAESIYGKLYTFNAANDSRNICPVGWHIPSQIEWQTLLNYVGTSAGEKLKEYGSKHWEAPNQLATDEYGFAALPGGLFRYTGNLSTYEMVRKEAWFWSSTSFNPTYPSGISVNIGNLPNPTEQQPSAIIIPSNYLSACSIRCIKD